MVQLLHKLLRDFEKKDPLQAAFELIWMGFQGKQGTEKKEERERKFFTSVRLRQGKLRASTACSLPW